jgi:hypothetical protein
VTCPSNVTYTGTALTPCSASITGVGGLNGLLTVDYADNTNAGTATASASYPGDSNHLPSNGSKTFAIDKASSTTTVTCPASVTFTGSALTPCSASATGAGGLNASLTPTYSNNINAGTGTANAAYGGDANHQASNGSKTFTITKAASTTTVICPASVVWVSGGNTPCTASVSGAGGLSVTGAPTYVNNTSVGAATASYGYAGDSNHLASGDSKTFQITTAFRIVGFDSPVDMTLDNAPQPRWNLVQNGRTVPLKFRVLNLDGSDVTSVAGLSAWASAAACETGWVDPVVLPTELTSNTGLMRTGDRFHFNWAVPKTAGKCYQVYIRTMDGSTVILASTTGTAIVEAFFKSK